MIQHIRTVLILLLLIFFSCKGKDDSEMIVKKNITISKINSPEKKNETFTFYKAFSFCENQVGYFTDQEAKDLYANKSIKLDANIINSSQQTYIKEKLDCIKRNLDINEIISTKYIKTKDVFPFDNLALFNNKYIVVSRDGYFFVFSNQNDNNSESKEISSLNGFESIVNHNLIGLSIIDEKARDPLKKYGLDSSTVCVCDSPSMYIDLDSKKLIIFNYCDSNESLNLIENKVSYLITNLETSSDKLVIFTNSNLKITFEKTTNFSIFQLRVVGDFPKQYVGNDLKLFFTPEPEKFQKEDCGDFGG